MAGLIILGFLIALGALSAAGYAADSRDREYGVGPLFAPRPRRAARPARRPSEDSGRHARRATAG